MEKKFSEQNRKKLQKMILKAFDSEIKTLAPELQSLLADDMVTALQNRILVLQKIQLEHSI